MSKRISVVMLALILVVLGLSAAVAEAPQTISVTHELGTAEVPVNPTKVVVFDFGTLDTINYLQVEGVELALPKSNVPAYLADYSGDAYTNAGDIKEPDMEAIFTFQPDIIFISGRQSAAYEELAAIAPTVYVSVNAETYMEDYTRNATLLGQIFGKEDEVSAALAQQDTRAAEVAEKAAASGEKALIILTNDGSVSAYGSGSRFGIIHDLLGVAEADESIDVSTHGQGVGFEYIAEINPDILYVVDRTVIVGGEQVAGTTLDNELVNGTNAAQNGKIIYLDPNVWYLSGGGIESVSQMIEETASAFE